MSFMGEQLIEMAKENRKKTLVTDEQFQRLTGSGGGTAYTPGEKWRNNKQYLEGDTVIDGNGNPYEAITSSINKPPSNNADYWRPISSGEPVYTAWSNDPVGTTYFVGDARKHNSTIWKCIKEHTKTAGNGPRQGSDLWGQI